MKVKCKRILILLALAAIFLTIPAGAKYAEVDGVLWSTSLNSYVLQTEDPIYINSSSEIALEMDDAVTDGNEYPVTSDAVHDALRNYYTTVAYTSDKGDIKTITRYNDEIYAWLNGLFGDEAPESRKMQKDRLYPCDLEGLGWFEEAEDSQSYFTMSFSQVERTTDRIDGVDYDCYRLYGIYYRYRTSTKKEEVSMGLQVTANSKTSKRLYAFGSNAWNPDDHSDFVIFRDEKNPKNLELGIRGWVCVYN